MKSKSIPIRLNQTSLWAFLVGVAAGALGLYLCSAKSNYSEAAANETIEGRNFLNRSKPKSKVAPRSELGSGTARQKELAGDSREVEVPSGEFTPRPCPLASAFVLSPAFRDEHNLTDETTIKIQNLLRKTHGELTEYTVRNVRRDETLDIPGENFVTYRVPADPEFGERLRAELETGIEAVGGKQVAVVLAELVRDQMDFLKFARCDLVFKLHESKKRPNHYQVTYSFTNPVSGEFGGGGQMGLANFNRSFGHIFSIAEE